MAKASIIKDLVDALGIAVYMFEKEIGVGNTTIGKAIERNANISPAIIEKIVLKYPNVNKMWLYSGEGSMFTDTLTEPNPTHEGRILTLWIKGKGYKVEDIAKKLGYADRAALNYHLQKEKLQPNFMALFKDRIGIDPKDIIEAANTQPKLSTKKEIIPLGKQVPLRLTADQYSEAFGDWQGLPMYNTPITASFVATYRDEHTYTPQYYLHDPRFRDCDFGAIITGDSMHSEIRHGDFVVCKQIIDKSFVVYGDIYYIVSKNGLETCKYINADKTNPDNWLLVPRNEAISPSPIHREMVDKLYKVKGIVRGY